MANIILVNKPETVKNTLTQIHLTQRNNYVPKYCGIWLS